MDDIANKKIGKLSRFVETKLTVLLKDLKNYIFQREFKTIIFHSNFVLNNFQYQKIQVDVIRKILIENIKFQINESPTAWIWKKQILKI